MHFLQSIDLFFVRPKLLRWPFGLTPRYLAFCTWFGNQNEFALASPLPLSEREPSRAIIRLPLICRGGGRQNSTKRGAPFFAMKQWLHPSVAAESRLPRYPILPPFLTHKNLLTHSIHKDDGGPVCPAPVSTDKP